MEWFKNCADPAGANNPTCQLLHATKVGLTPGISNEEVAKQTVHWNRIAAEGGQGLAAVKVARAYLKTLSSHLPNDEKEAQRLFQQAADDTDEPEAHFGLAQLLTMQVARGDFGPILPSVYTYPEAAQDTMDRAIGHFEAAAAGNHPFAAFNLGIAHLYGYLRIGKNPELAGAWFEASGLPEGLYLRAVQLRSAGKTKEADQAEAAAKARGFGAPWRRKAREVTGSGGAGGVDLNCIWPPTRDGSVPTKW